MSENNSLSSFVAHITETQQPPLGKETKNIQISSDQALTKNIISTMFPLSTIDHIFLRQWFAAVIFFHCAHLIEIGLKCTEYTQYTLYQQQWHSKRILLRIYF